MPRQDVGIEQVPGLARGHVGAGAPARDHEALGRQDLERLANCLAADVVVRRQLQFARQQSPLGDHAGGDPAADLMGNPAVQGRGGVKTFVDQGSRTVGREGWCLRKSCINLAATAKVVHCAFAAILQKSLQARVEAGCQGFARGSSPRRDGASVMDFPRLADHKAGFPRRSIPTRPPSLRRLPADGSGAAPTRSNRAPAGRNR